MTPDIINGVFEICGSVATWGTFAAIRKDRGYAGMRLPIMAFFTSWGFWNLYFYSHLLQWFSLVASLSLTAGNVAIVAAMLYYGRKRETNEERPRDVCGCPTDGTVPEASDYYQGSCCDDNGPGNTHRNYLRGQDCPEGKRCTVDIHGFGHPACEGDEDS